MSSADRFWTGTAVVTGAGSGLGASMVERFAAVGMSILALDIDGERAEQTAQAVRDKDGRAIARRVGYPDPGYFIRRFRTDHAMTPNQWRRQA